MDSKEYSPLLPFIHIASAAAIKLYLSEHFLIFFSSSFIIIIIIWAFSHIIVKLDADNAHNLCMPSICGSIFKVILIKLDIYLSVWPWYLLFCGFFFCCCIKSKEGLCNLVLLFFIFFSNNNKFIYFSCKNEIKATLFESHTKKTLYHSFWQSLLPNLLVWHKF